MEREHTRRYPELDALRGLAVLLMMAYHFLFDLSEYYGFNVPYISSLAIARCIASLFLLVIGICFVISWDRTPHDKRWAKAGKRAVVLLAASGIISGATWLFDPASFVRFGILHLIGVGALLQPLFRPLGRWNALAGAALILTMLALPMPGSWWLLPLGIVPSGFFSVDYYPLLPWFGVVLLGMSIGDFCYVPSPRAALAPLQSFPFPRWLTGTGQYALLLYFLHQPVFLLLLRIYFGR